MIKNIFKMFLIGFFLFMILFISSCVENTNKICYNNSCFEVEIVHTDEKKKEGLMYRDNLERDKGMLFYYETDAIRGFWMKNTYIPLDIIWLDKDYKVVYIEHQVEPCLEESCPTYYPGVKSRYVLELNAGIAENISLEEGSKMKFYGSLDDIE